MATTTTRSRGKSTFVKEFLFDNPQAAHKAVNEAWENAGMEGTISGSLVGKIRSELGLTGNLRDGTAKTAAGATKSRTANPAAKAKYTRAAKPAGRTPARPDRSDVLEEVEGEIDRLIFKLIAVGGLGDVEDALRRVRRQLVRSHKA